MPQFIPLKFYQYHWSDQRVEPEKVISPPYDVLSPEDIKALTGEEFNVVHLDSPKSYEDAALQLNSWILKNILVRDKTPGFYIMATDYSAGGLQKTRWGVFGGLKVHPFEDKKVFPHEQTYPKAKNDRLNLMKATHAQLSPIFGIYHDPDLTLESMGRECLDSTPVISFNQESGVYNRIWKVPAHHHQALEDMLENKKVFIADGHHRYETALNYQKLMPAGKEAPWNHVFTYLSNISSPGLEIFPYHRMVSQSKMFDWDQVISRAEKVFSLSFAQQPDHFTGHVRADSFILYYDKGAVLFTPLENPKDTFSRIGAHVLDKLFLRGAMELTEEQLASSEIISYTHNPDNIINSVDQGFSQAGFILSPVPMDVLQEVCEKGQIMPRKSTFFYPKLPTGVLFHLWGERPV
jgi:uncharacterized protein (DUF1015 family)